MNPESNQVDWTDEPVIGADDRELTPEEEKALAKMVQPPSWEAQVETAFQELFERLITLENVLISVIALVSENAHSPAVMAQELKGLLVTEGVESPDTFGEDQDGTNPSKALPEEG